MLRLLSTTPNWWEDYPCLRQVSTEDVNVDLDVLQAGINLSGRGHFHRDRASRRVAMKRLYQRHPVNTLCQEGVRQCTGMMAAMLFLLLILYRIRSKRSRAQPHMIKIRDRARQAVVRAIKADREDRAKVKGGSMTHLKSAESNHKAERNVEALVCTPKDRTVDPSNFMASTSPAPVMSLFDVRGHVYLWAVIRQRLLMSGDVELNPGPIDGM